APVVHAHHEPEHAEAQGRPEELLLEEEVRVVEPIGGDDRARRVDHHHAPAQEGEHHEEEPAVRAHLARHQGDSGRASTSALKTPPRCSWSRNMPKEAHAGESSTPSPGPARAAARSTASAIDPASWTAVTARRAGPRVARPSPMRTAALTRPRAASAS